ncbi:FAD-dependent monooxygenase [Microbacterium sp. MYb62]|uniref:FAD-dependent monooxygenase n=1 Tax=Microbacterium sp. MYb62 TaxID=1848690 RepID=UPI000CFBD68D|nr:FAD-dependent monooxygenase [Microbacterium sp. MYb62]PRB18437.1 2,4-dichlorophenol 6-monooxygenase [Microbacterium sp. MYb62]
MTPEEVATDVLIVGAGPAGLTLAALLARYGIDAITVSKFAGTARTPRAHITNQRAMEVYRDLKIEDEVNRIATPSDLMSNNVWATSFAGTEIARLQTWGTSIERQADYDAVSPSRMCNAPQHRLEPVLRASAEGQGADLRFGVELIEITQDEHGVRAVVRDESGVETLIRAQYVVGADGARSTVGEQLGFRFSGESGLGAALNIFLEADLSEYCAHRPGVLYWMTQPGNNYWVGSGTWICVTPFREWVNLSMYDPAEGEPDLSESALIERVRSTIGDDTVDVTIKSVSKWQINHVVAESYQCGRAFLVGDAAHRHPPAGGLGSNTSVQDSFSLAWRLAYVIRGLAGPELLATYDAERQPIGRKVVDRAIESVGNMGPIADALGFAPGQSIAEGWDNLEDLFSATPHGADRRAALEAAIELQHYQFNAHGFEFDLRYESAAVVDDGTDWPRNERDPALYATPSTHPGAPLAHARVQRDSALLSTIDLVGDGVFTLVTGIADGAWREAAATVSSELGVVIRVAQVAVRGEYDDVYGDWTRVRGVGDAGALLVRPDRVVSWRVTEEPEDAVAALRTALGAVLARA